MASYQNKTSARIAERQLIIQCGGESVWYKIPEKDRNELIKSNMRSKYNSISTEYKGKRYRSKKEVEYVMYLDSLMAEGKIISWEYEPKMSLDVNGYHIANYYVDFRVLHVGGDVEYVEVKGFETDTWKMKARLFEALYCNKGQAKYTVVK